VDGKLQLTANGSASDNFQTALYNEANLPYGQHEVILTNSGDGEYLDLDFIVLTVGDGSTYVISVDLYESTSHLRQNHTVSPNHTRGWFLSIRFQLDGWAE
jgi:hypothetical protein